MEPTRSSCYTHLYKKAAEVLGLVDCRNPDDVFKAIIAGKSVDRMEITRLIVNAALDAYDEHG